jgi:hypothetical protein
MGCGGAEAAPFGDADEGLQTEDVDAHASP